MEEFKKRGEEKSRGGEEYSSIRISDNTILNISFKTYIKNDYRKYLLLHFIFKQTLLLPSSVVSPTQQNSQVSILQYGHFHE